MHRGDVCIGRLGSTYHGTYSDITKQIVGCDHEGKCTDGSFYSTWKQLLKDDANFELEGLEHLGMSDLQYEFGDYSEQHHKLSYKIRHPDGYGESSHPSSTPYTSLSCLDLVSGSPDKSCPGSAVDYALVIPL